MGQENRGGAELYALYDHALPQIYGYLLDRCGDRMTAEDLASETFIDAARTLGRHPETRPSIPWLVGVARHKLADHWRQRERDQRYSEGPDPERVEDPWDERMTALDARAVLERLADHHRLVLTLRYVDDLSVPAVAEILGRTVFATEALLSRARSAFRTRYESRDGHGH